MTEKSSTVSIITRTRDRTILLGRAVESVLGQSFADWRHIIVNDGGNAEELEEFLAPYFDRYAGRLTVVHNEKSLGMQQASNVGLAKAAGTYVAIHDDDDEWAPEFLTATTRFLDEKGPESVYQGVIAQTIKVMEDIDTQGRVLEVSREPYLPASDVNLFKVGYENPFPPIAFLYRRKVHEVIGPFDPRFDFAGDMDFNVHFLLHWEIGVIPRPLAFYHWRRKSVVAGFDNSVTARADEHVAKFNEFLNHYLRLQAGNDEKGIGLALNLGRHAVAASVAARAALERIDDQNGRLTDFKEHLKSVSGTLESVVASEEEAAQREADLKAHLNSLGGQLETLRASGNESAAREGDLKEHLKSVSGTLSGDALPRIADLKEHLKSVSGTLENVVASEEEAAQREADLKAHLNSLTGQMEKLEWENRNALDRDMTLADSIRAIRSDMDRWREEERNREKERAKGLRIGRLWIRWRRKGEL